MTTPAKIFLNAKRTTIKLTTNSGRQIKLVPAIAYYPVNGGSGGSNYIIGRGLFLNGNILTTDPQLIPEFGDLDQTLATANGYTDNKISEANSTTYDLVSEMRNEAETYADEQIAHAETQIAQDIAIAKSEAETYTDQQVSNANAYADSAAATALASAKTYSDSELAPVRDLAQINQLNISTKVDQADFDTLSTQVSTNTLDILGKANQTTLDALAAVVDTKATPADITAAIAALVDGAPASLDTLKEIADMLNGEQATIDSILTALGNRVRVDAAQSFTSTEQDQGRANILAEKLGTAATLIAAITPASIGAATAAQGAKADTAIQSGDLAPVALSGDYFTLTNRPDAQISANTTGLSAVSTGLSNTRSAISAVSTGLNATNSSVSAVSTGLAGVSTGLSNTNSTVSAVSTGLGSVSTALSNTNSTQSSISSGLGSLSSGLSNTNSVVSTLSNAVAPTKLTPLTANYSILASDMGKILRDANYQTYTLPTAASIAAAGYSANNMWYVEVWNIGSVVGSYTNVIVQGADTLDSTTTALPVNQGNGFKFYCDGANFYSCSTRSPRGIQDTATVGTRPIVANYRNTAYLGQTSWNVLGLGATMIVQFSSNNINLGGTAYGSSDIGIGVGNIVGNSGVTNGYNVAIGYQSKAGTLYGHEGSTAVGRAANASYKGSMAFGYFATTVINNEIVWGGKLYATTNRRAVMLAALCTAASTDYYLTSDATSAAATNQISVPASTTVTFKGVVHIRQKGTAGNTVGAYEIRGTITRQSSGNVSLLSSTVTDFGGITNPSGWVVSLVADTTNQALGVKFNMGSTALSLQAACEILYMQTTYA